MNGSYKEFWTEMAGKEGKSMMGTSKALQTGMVLLCGVFLYVYVPGTAQAQIGEIRVAVGMGGAGTEWRTDAVMVTQLKIDLRFFNFIGLYGDFGLAYAGVDQRVISQFALGIQAWARIGITRPFVRVSWVHQHEESLSMIAGDFAKAFFGIGEGIRHRGGVGFGLGTDIPVFRRKKLELFVTIEAQLRWFPGDMGPVIYAGGNVAFGLSYGM